MLSSVSGPRQVALMRQLPAVSAALTTIRMRTGLTALPALPTIDPLQVPASGAPLEALPAAALAGAATISAIASGAERRSNANIAGAHSPPRRQADRRAAGGTPTASPPIERTMPAARRGRRRRACAVGGDAASRRAYGRGANVVLEI